MNTSSPGAMSPSSPRATSSTARGSDLKRRAWTLSVSLWIFSRSTSKTSLWYCRRAFTESTSPASPTTALITKIHAPNNTAHLIARMTPGLGLENKGGRLVFNFCAFTKE